MAWQNLPYTQQIFRFSMSPEEGAHAADVAEQFVPGGRAFVQQLFRAKKDLLKGISELLEAQMRELDSVDTAIKDEKRERWTGDAGIGLLTYPFKRALAVKQGLAQMEQSFLQSVVDGMHHAAKTRPASGGSHAPEKKTEKVKVE